MNRDGEGVRLGGTLACCCLPLLTIVHLLKRVELKLMFKLQVACAMSAATACTTIRMSTAM